MRGTLHARRGGSAAVHGRKKRSPAQTDTRDFATAARTRNAGAAKRTRQEKAGPAHASGRQTTQSFGITSRQLPGPGHARENFQPAIQATKSRKSSRVSLTGRSQE